MASIAEVVEGLEILAKTSSVPAGLAEKGVTDTRTAFVNAQHEIIYGPLSANPSKEDQERLCAAGWHFDTEAEVWARFT